MKQWWRRWTYEVPLAIADALWEVLVVQLAALLDRLTVRKVIAFIPVAIIILAYYHRIPIPPELILVGDFLAYIDIFSALILFGVMSRVTTILFAVKQVAAAIAAFTSNVASRLQRMDARHGRQRSGSRPHRQPSRTEEDRAFDRAWDQVAIV